MHISCRVPNQVLEACADQRFDPDRGFQFSTLATWWVRQRIGRYARRYHAQRAVSLDAEDTEGRRMIDRVPGSVSMDPELAVIARQVLSILSPREAAVMALRWDL